MLKPKRAPFDSVTVAGHDVNVTDAFVRAGQKLADLPIIIKNLKNNTTRRNRFGAPEFRSDDYYTGPLDLHARARDFSSVLYDVSADNNRVVVSDGSTSRADQPEWNAIVRARTKVSKRRMSCGLTGFRAKNNPN